MSEPQDTNEASGGRSDSTAVLAAGDRIAIQWGYGACTGKILAVTDGRYFVAMDCGGMDLMDTADLMRRKFIRLPQRKLSFWRRLIGG